MARPKSDNAKRVGYRIRLTEEELNLLKEKAKESNMTVAEYIRNLLFG